MALTSSLPPLAGRSQLLLGTITGLLALAFVSALADVVVTALATSAVGVQYGFQVVGVLFAAVPQLAALLAVIAGLGTLGGQRLTMRTTAIVAILLGLVCLLLMGPFVLDFLQARRMVSQNGLKGFTIAGLKTAGFAGVFGLLMVWTGWRALQASAKSEQTEKRVKGQGLVVGQDA